MSKSFGGSVQQQNHREGNGLPETLLRKHGQHSRPKHPRQNRHGDGGHHLQGYLAQEPADKRTAVGPEVQQDADRGYGEHVAQGGIDQQNHSQRVADAHLLEDRKDN